LAARIKAGVGIVERDPLEDIEMIRDVLLIVNNGGVVVNRLSP
jgi:hypothetical protein